MPDRKHDRPSTTPEFEVAYYTKELGQTLQRQMLRTQLARFIGAGRVTGGSGQEEVPEDAKEPGPGTPSC